MATTKAKTTKTTKSTKSTKTTTPVDTSFTETVKDGSTTVDANNYNDWNKQVQAKIDAAKAKGLDVSYDYDDNGALHYTTKGADKLSNILGYYNTSSTTGTTPTYNINGTTYNVKTAAQQQAETAQAEAAAAQAAADEANNTLAAYYENAKQNALDNAQDTYNINASQLANIYNQQAAAANEDADDAARQQYILYKQSKDKLGEQLSSQGITGGASETALNSILNAYTSGLATNEKARQNALTELGNTYQNDLTDLQAQLANDKAGIDSSYDSAIANAKAQEQEDAEEAAKAYAEQQAAADVAKWNESVQKKINEVNPKYTWTDDDGKLHWSNTESAANTAKAMGYKVATSSGVTSSAAEWNKSVSAKIKEVNPKYTWTDSDGKLHWSNDQATANTAKASGYKVTTRADEKTTSSSSSSNSSKKKVTSTSTTTKDTSTKDTSSKSTDNPFKSTKTTTSNNDKNSTNYDYVLRMTKVLTATPATYTQAVNYVKGTGLTTKQKQKVLKEVGLL